MVNSFLSQDHERRTKSKLKSVPLLVPIPNNSEHQVKSHPPELEKGNEQEVQPSSFFFPERIAPVVGRKIEERPIEKV